MFHLRADSGLMKIGREALLLWLLLAVTYAYFYQDPAWNGNSRFALAVSFVQSGSLNIDAFHNRPETGFATGDKSFYNGHYYSDKAIGSSVLAAIAYFPIYWLMKLTGVSLPPEGLKQILTFLAMSLPSSICGLLIYLFCAQVSPSKLRALIVTSAVCLGTMIFPYSVTFFGHQLAGTFLFSAFYIVFKLKNSTGDWNNWLLWLVGWLLGMALITEFTTLLVVAPIGIYFLWSIQLYGTTRKQDGVGGAIGLRLSNFGYQEIGRNLRFFYLPLLGGLIPLALMFAYNTICFGSPLTIGYNNLPDPMFQAGMAAGVMGIGRPSLRVLFFETFHPAEGLFWQSPVLLMALPGWFFLFKSRRLSAEGLLAAFAVAAYLVMNAGYYMWWGGDAMGPRAIIPMLPCFAIPLICVPKRFFPWVVGLTLISIGQMLLAGASTTLVSADAIMQNLKAANLFAYSTLYNYCWWKLSNGVFALNLGQQIFGLQDWISLMPLALIWVGGTAGFWRLVKSGTSPDLSRQIV